MLRNVSSSSSEEEETEAPPPESSRALEHVRYRCPSDFVTFCHEPCRSTWNERLKDDNTELWLIKAPTGFNPESVRGVQVALSGLQTVSVPSDGGEQQIYRVLASNHSPPELRLLTANNRVSKSMAFGPAFSGLMNVFESYGDGGAARTPHVIPAAPPPSIPAGLKRRFQTTPPALSEVDGNGNATAEENRKNRKRRKKEKRRQEEEEEGVTVKQEVKEEVLTEETTTRRRKKKKKEREEEGGVEQSEEVKEEEVSVKSEPMDSSYGDVTENYDKKKKKKKKSRRSDD